MSDHKLPQVLESLLTDDERLESFDWLVKELTDSVVRRRRLADLVRLCADWMDSVPLAPNDQRVGWKIRERLHAELQTDNDYQA